MSGRCCSAPSIRASWAPANGRWLLSRLSPDQRLDEEESAAADLETWEWDTERKVRELLELNRLAAALSSVRARAERSPGSPLYKAEAEILDRMKRWEEARAVLEAGAESAGEKGDSGLVIDLLLRAVRPGPRSE